MTTTTAAAAPARQPNSGAYATFILVIKHLPVRLRARVEDLLARLVPPSQATPSTNADVWETTWFTRWQPDRTSRGTRAVGCRELVQAPRESMRAFAA